LHTDLHNGHNAIQNCEPVRKVFDVQAKGAGDDGENHVQEVED
jgi:hypothetical protein